MYALSSVICKATMLAVGSILFSDTFYWCLSLNSCFVLLFRSRAFAIWGPIYLGEMAMVASQWLLLDESSSSPTRAILQEASAPFVVANVFQSLWCASFRPKYNKGFYMYLSWAMLTGTAFSLSKVHETYSYSSSSNNGVSFGQYCLYFLPLSLHFGWTTAASLVNLNGAVALNPSASPRVVAWVGHATVIGASALGAAISLTRSAPVFGGVITWALLAVADGMKQRLQSTEKKNDDKTEITGTYGAKTQLQLSRIGALVSGLAALTATIQLWTGSN
jgi:hypothetical protein